MSGTVSDMLAVAEALARSKEADAALREALGKLTDNVSEQNSALADVVEALEKSGDTKPAIDHEALGKAIAAAVVVAIKAMPVPKIEMPAAAPAPEPWGTIKVKTPKGEVYEITRKS